MRKETRLFLAVGESVRLGKSRVSRPFRIFVLYTEIKMDITFKTRKLAKIFNSEKALYNRYGADKAKIIMRRMMLLKAALADISHLPPERRHELRGAAKGIFAVDIKHPYRLVFTPNHAPLPLKDDGGIDLNRITAITILAMEDYH